MGTANHILALDQGTTSSRAMVFDASARVSRSPSSQRLSSIRNPAGSIRTRPKSGQQRSRQLASRSPPSGLAGHRYCRHRHREPARNARRLGSRDERAGLPGDCLAEPPEPAAGRSAAGPRHGPGLPKQDRSGSRTPISRHRNLPGSSKRNPTCGVARKPESSSPVRSIPGCSGI